MNVLMMTNTYKPLLGGLEKSIEVLTAQLRERGHHVMIVAPEHDGAPAREAGVTRIPAIQKFSGSDFSINLPVPGIMTRLVKSFRPDVIHSHHPFLIGDMALRIAGQYDVPLVYTYHTMFEWYRDYFGLEHAPVRRFVMQLAVGYANLCDHVIVPSESIRRILSARGLKAPSTVCPTGVDTGRFRSGNGQALREKFGLAKDDYVMGYAGRFSKEKNLIFLLGAAARHLREDSKARILLVGSGGKYEKRIRAYLQRQNLDEKVIRTGRLDGQELIDAYHAMDVFIFASRSETQGIVVGEAMAAGRPVIALDAPGVREVVRNEQNGFLVRRQNHRDFAAALSQYAQLGPDMKEKFREAARRTAEKMDLCFFGPAVLEVYKKLEARKPESEAPEESDWEIWMNRLETEWELLGNVGTALTAAFTGMLRDGQKQIREKTRRLRKTLT